jgi:hypothetical protein
MTLLRSPIRSQGVALALAGASLLLAAPAATAASVHAPPGNAGIMEYVESVPDGGGDRIGNDLYHARGTVLRHGSRLLNRPTSQRLARSGRDGPMAAGLAAAAAPQTSHGVAGGDAGKSATASAAGLLAGQGSGGLGALLPVLLTLMLGAAAGYALRRRQAGS